MAKPPSNAKPAWMARPYKKVEQGELRVDRPINDDDMYMFELRGKRMQDFRKATLENSWEKAGKPSWDIHVVLCWKNGNARLVTKYT